MPDGWEIWFARWNVIDDEWTLNPLQPSDRWLDADDDGMTNWEEYNLIDSSLSETNSNRSSPQWFVTTLGSAYAFQQWPSASTTYSFGTYMTTDQYNLTGPTGDPNNVDTDGDGIIDGLELLFTAWNISAQTWTLNPVVAGDGTFDSDNDGLVDLQEFALATSTLKTELMHRQMLHCCMRMETYNSLRKRRSVSSKFSFQRIPVESDCWTISTLGNR